MMCILASKAGLNCCSSPENTENVSFTTDIQYNDREVASHEQHEYDSTNICMVSLNFRLPGDLSEISGESLYWEVSKLCSCAVPRPRRPKGCPTDGSAPADKRLLGCAP